MIDEIKNFDILPKNFHLNNELLTPKKWLKLS
jgi:hypothetical protein